MVSFSTGFADKMRERLKKYEEADRTEVSAKVKVVVDKLDDLASTARGRNPHSWSADENGPSPLEYFISALGLCQCVHYAEHAAASGIRLESLRIEINGDFRVTRPRNLKKLEYTVLIQSPEKLDVIRELALKASADCYVTQTLKRACEVRGHLLLNGVDIGEIF
ncbi:hypothetical protein B9Q04_17925 [Candidatus Marsarchaeota G2 archaeon BE_D]|jgi:Predicted redox protein, regulator of disulfide bond formation|uniref:Osmotically inducible protein OsmC n=4 Tax=Candidatus Marsarchaeota group 2 TaxID=2203771 RepID=A0A2R6C5S2_9ARCH|nr:MAG: hypothetical protein B9Q06_07680 [Candidatus Marsarchaeota G2 archaeon ECH_B_2]PSN99349.1 MAG: hypothetical protein B9Q07_07175 [Candidatus Marsarchaeota G2 archaeon ECH_B_3]PSO01654.1 MAG: hypothetical protein B9Q05_08060 [Candidatus Marsarchaeota G2 archaeon ECH_B_1]PSO06076.1 MAG: hypothetical protein B9Q04_17925 [Candidatus Marsarchaeota G2 archaeon BE_D]